MGKIALFMVTSLDGFYEGPGGAFDWPLVDEEFTEFGLAQLAATGTLLFGRVTYEGMAAYWPSPAAQRDDPATAAVMNVILKVVVSRTLERADRAGSRVVRSLEEVAELRAEPGRRIVVFGSSALCVGLLERGLLDEVRVMVNPVVPGLV
ncbi:dihydrofolate reductase family protein [Kitasatospora sp. NPDC051914]|uniref:dihydrofolate reductase family protein n=1 Tax=Kitasatospora sp. NPDC051914 TaxID=3154945 RepID=UPI0034447472